MKMLKSVAVVVVESVVLGILYVFEGNSFVVCYNCFLIHCFRQSRDVSHVSGNLEKRYVSLEAKFPYHVRVDWRL